MEPSVVPLHQHPHFIKDCCKLINSEWPRSEAARLHSLSCSCDTLPVSLILLHEKEVIGHCKLSKIPSIPDSCFVESVVIKKEFRSRGFGSLLMKKAEEYCKCTLNLKSIHLSTRGQEIFYSKLGYTECEPISIYGASIKVSAPKSEWYTDQRSLPGPPPLPKFTLPDYLPKTYMRKFLTQ